MEGRKETCEKAAVQFNDTAWNRQDYGKASHF
jgi:hypothetical protein